MASKVIMTRSEREEVSEIKGRKCSRWERIDQVYLEREREVEQGDEFFFGPEKMDDPEP